MQRLRIAFIALFVLALGATPTHAQQDWSFSDVDSIDLDGVSGDVIVRQEQGAEIRIMLAEEVRPAGAFHGVAAQRGSTIFIDEDWQRGTSRGSVEWTLVIPASLRPEITIHTASGDLEASGVQAHFEFETASGDIRLDSMTLLEGSSFDTASGDIVLTNVVVEDDVDFNTASGSVRVMETALGGPSKFSSASGDVDVRLTGAPEHDIDASSASGDVRFEAGFGNNFTLIMTKREDRGRIDSPFEPTSEETFRRNGRLYIRQTVERGSGGPEIRVSTSAGSIEVRNGR